MQCHARTSRIVHDHAVVARVNQVHDVIIGAADDANALIERLLDLRPQLGVSERIRTVPALAV